MSAASAKNQKEESVNNRTESIKGELRRNTNENY
jgi:hypothetical protein